MLYVVTYTWSNDGHYEDALYNNDEFIGVFDDLQKAKDCINYFMDKDKSKSMNIEKDEFEEINFDFENIYDYYDQCLFCCYEEGDLYYEWVLLKHGYTNSISKRYDITKIELNDFIKEGS